MEIVFLEADKPLTKRFELDSKKKLIKHSYPHVLDFTSHREKHTTLKSLARSIRAHGKLNHCLLKGTIQRDLVMESRAGSTDRNKETRWLCLDIDGLKNIKSVADFLLLLPPEFQNVDHIIQYSSSMGIDIKKGLSAHVFFMLDRNYTPAALKGYLTKLNLTIPVLEKQLSLSRTKNVLKWPLDISVAQNDKLLYIAPPILGAGVIDHSNLPQVSFVELSKRTLAPDLQDTNPEALKTTSLKKINILRKAEGLDPRRNSNEKIVNSIPVACAVSEASITGIKEDRGFIYLNLNGGDSWAYYHAVNNYEVLYNFKGEPNYLLKDILPSYYQELVKKSANSTTTNPDLEYLYFLDRRTDTYFRGVYNKKTNTHSMHRTQKSKTIDDFLKQNGLPKPDFIPEWDVEFDFNNNNTIDIKNRFLNLFHPSEYLLNTTKPTKIVPPAIIHRIIFSALGGDADTVEHFYNWLACILQHRTKIPTAWVLQGTQGTGKGLLFNNILKPIIGSRHAAHTNLPMYEEPYNGFMETSVFVLIDEAQISKIGAKDKLMARVKQYISEPFLGVRRMHTDLYSAKNFSHFIIATNKHDPIEVDMADRRLNVCNRQELRLQISSKEIASIAGELQGFTDYLISRPADLSIANTLIQTTARQQLQDLTRDSAEAVADALHAGDIQFFIDNHPDTTVDAEMRIMCANDNMPGYDEALQLLYSAASGDCKISRDTMETLFYYTAGQKFLTRNKFTKFIGHKGIYLEQLRIDGVKKRGITVLEWDITDEVREYFNPSESSTKPKVTSKVSPITTPTKRVRRRKSE